jgi:PAS domain S-box-containing protein
MLLCGLALSAALSINVARELEPDARGISHWQPMAALGAVHGSDLGALQSQMPDAGADGSGSAILRALPGMVLLGGCMVSLLLFGVLRSLALSGRIAQRLARIMVGKLRESERRIAETEKFSSVMVLHVALDGRLLKAPPTFCRLLGYREDELAAIRLENLVHRDDAAVSWRPIKRLTRGKIKSVDCEKRCVRKDGGIVWLSLSCSLVAADRGDARYFLVYARDTTAQKQSREALVESESRLAGIINSAMDAIITVDADGRILVFNTAAEKMFRCKSPDILGKPVTLLIPGGYAEAHRDPARTGAASRLSTRAIGASRPLTGLRSSGEEFPIEASISRMSISGRPVDTVIMRDITDRLQSEAQLQRLYSELEQRVQQRTAELEAANHELESFSYSVSHDLRAPVRHIAGFVNMLEEGGEGQFSEQQKRYLSRISAASERMGRLIDDLLSFSRTSRTELRLARVDMRVSAQRALDELAPEMAGRSVRVTIGELPVVHADSALLHLVWVNLLSNAIKYTAPRAQAVIELGTRPGRRDEVIFFMRDNGVGFDPEYADNLFGVFQRLHTQTQFEGTGVGLATVQRIVHRHGGKVWAEGAVDQGATFYFSLGHAPAPAAAENHNDD